MKGDITIIYVVRHGQSLGNAAISEKPDIELNVYGELQSPLSKLGIKQAQKVANKLKHVYFDAIFSSDLERARATAEIIAKERNLSIITESTIRERFWGNRNKGFTKKHREKIEEGLKALNDEEKLLYRYFPDGETAMEAINRFLTFLKKIIPFYKRKTILVVNHGNIMRSFLIHLQWATYAELPAGTIVNTGYYVLKTDGARFTVTETWGVNKKITVENNEE